MTKIGLDKDVTLSILKFVCGENEHLCRLCLNSAETSAINLEDEVKLQKHYCDETVSYLTILENYGVHTESLLPQVICKSCAAAAINSFLFKKLCQYSNDKWENTIHTFNAKLLQSDILNSYHVKTAYIVVNKKENLIFTSRKKCSRKSRKTILLNVKDISKSRRKYYQLKHDPRDTICDECGERFASEFLLEKHIKIHNKCKYPCSDCTKIFSSCLQLEEHAARVHHPKILKCDKCPKMFSTQKILRIHERTHHTVAKCKYCSMELPSRYALRTHLDTHEIHICKSCNKNFINRLTFKSHIKLCGRDIEKQNFICDICKKSYARKNGLRTHLKTDHGFGNVISCEWCNKKFDAVSRYKNHIVKHTKEKRFNCDQCGGKFVSRAALIYHVRLHTGERPFPCDLCEESFLSASRRMEHKRRKHIGPTKECSICYMKFITTNQLRKHLKRHFNPQSKLYVTD